MAIDKVIDSAQLDADLTSVADAIRTKGGTSAALAFPAGFVSAVEAIETGGGGGSPQTFTFDNTITTTGGRDDAHAIVTGLLPFHTFEVVGYAYLVGATSTTKMRVNFGLTSDLFAGDFKINADGDTTTLFRITGEFSNGAMTYRCFYDGAQLKIATTKIMYDGFSFHWITTATEETPIVIHASVTGS